MAQKHTVDKAKTTNTSFDILELLVESDGARVSEVSDHLGIAKSTAHRHLFTLFERGYLIKEGDQYHISARFLALGNHAKTRKEELQLVCAKTEEIAERTGERAQFVIEEHGRAVYVHVARGEKAVKTNPRIGRTFPMHVGAASKVILAHLPEDRVREIVETHGLNKKTDNTITNINELFEELEEIRNRGYSFHREEYIEGLNAVGVPIRGSGNQIVGGISVGGPKHRLKGDLFEDELPNLLRGAANEIEINIGFY